MPSTFTQLYIHFVFAVNGRCNISCSWTVSTFPMANNTFSNSTIDGRTSKPCSPRGQSNATFRAVVVRPPRPTVPAPVGGEHL